MISMFRRLRVRSLLDAMTTPGPSPIYVLNLLQFRNLAPYRWYGLFVYPMVRATGGTMVWAGHHVEALHGEPRFDNLIIVTYPSHLRFLLMIANPWYALINELREAGVERFEGAFSERVAGAHQRNLRARHLLVLQGNPGCTPAMDAADRLLQAAGAEHLLTIQQYLSVPAMDPVLPSDPNPHSYQRNAFYRVGDVASMRALQEQLGNCGEGISVQLYEVSPRRAYLPGQPLPAWGC